MQVQLSALEVDGYSKDDRAQITFYREKPYNKDFKELCSMMLKDYIYSPFTYDCGYRSAETIISKAQFVVIDVDDTKVSIFDRHLELIEEELTHIIATTSTTSNEYKYRVLLPISEKVTPKEYRNLVNGMIINGLMSDMDKASKKPSQPFYSYKDSTLYSYFEGTTLNVQDYSVEEVLEEFDPSELTDLSFIEKKVYLMDKYSYGNIGNRHQILVSASFTMLKLGLTQSQFVKAIQAVNKNWLEPVEVNKLHSTVINTMKHKFKRK